MAFCAAPVEEETQQTQPSNNVNYKYEMPSSGYDLNGPNNPLDLQWVIALAASKKTHLKNLKRLVFEDEHLPRTVQVPPIVQRALDDAEIKSSMLICFNPLPFHKLRGRYITH